MEGLVGTKIKGCEKAVVVQETHVQKIRILVGFLQMVLLTLTKSRITFLHFCGHIGKRCPFLAHTQKMTPENTC